VARNLDGLQRSAIQFRDQTSNSVSIILAGHEEFRASLKPPRRHLDEEKRAAQLDSYPTSTERAQAGITHSGSFELRKQSLHPVLINVGQRHRCHSVGTSKTLPDRYPVFDRRASEATIAANLEGRHWRLQEKREDGNQQKQT